MGKDIIYFNLCYKVNKILVLKLDKYDKRKVILFWLDLKINKLNNLLYFY